MTSWLPALLTTLLLPLVVSGGGDKRSLGKDDLGEVLKELYLELMLENRAHHNSVRTAVDESAAREWLENHNKEMAEMLFHKLTAAWAYQTNITDANKKVMMDTSEGLGQFASKAAKQAAEFPADQYSDRLIRRQLNKITQSLGTSALSPDKMARFSELKANMEEMYVLATVCNKPGDTEKKCYSVDAELLELITSSSDWHERLWVWKGSRDAVGPAKMIPAYEEMMKLQNEAAKLTGFNNYGEIWRLDYEDPHLQDDVARMWAQIKPLYEQLHAYVRRKLKQHYHQHAKSFPDSGHIPAHIIGDLWSQTWISTEPILRAFPGTPGFDVTDEMVKQGYEVLDLFETAEEFFITMGMQPMPRAFWQHSMIEEPKDGRKVICHASAWDFYNQKDFRVKQCSLVSQKWLTTTQHEMGHIQYYLEYRHQPVVFRRGANPGFHEAVGDVISLSVDTPEHLMKLGLLKDFKNGHESDMNFLLGQALKKLAFVPFGYLVDHWRYGIFEGNITRKEYNKKWWEYRCKLQGIYPPVKRTAEDFDPGVKYHIPSNVPYIRYFFSHVLQYQFHKTLCKAANHKGPLHKCDIHSSKEAGDKLRSMLKLGSSVSPQTVLEQLTGSRQTSPDAILEYFKPLHDWLKKQNSGHVVGWSENECPNNED